MFYTVTKSQKSYPLSFSPTLAFNVITVDTYLLHLLTRSEVWYVYGFDHISYLCYDTPSLHFPFLTNSAAFW